jgi:hypothetical protein
LFTVARYLSGKRDSRFAKACRQAILASVGVVVFPDIPEVARTKEETIAHTDNDT